MKTISLLTKKTEQFAIYVMTMFFSVLAFAQDSLAVTSTETTTTTTTTEEWVSNPLYWVIGALLLIVLIAFVARGNKKS